MPDGNDSFLPRIQSVFYSVFDVHHGPKIVYQVPEGLIATSGTTPTEAPSPAQATSPFDYNRPARNLLNSPTRKAGSSNQSLFNFDDVSKYVIPPSQLCGRLVTCSTRSHRIIGFPVELHGKYQRNYFRYNLCFVFERTADLSCYEPIVRKISRVLTSCEKESAFLSSPGSSSAIHAILEQLYEDLNSYSETSIPINRFNSIELKIFPFYPNPPKVKDWMVPVALINIPKRIEDNWDLTMVKVCKYIDGINHVSRIAQLADCDITLTRAAISHLLYYQVIMTIDIFQFSNMYTLRKSIQWLADQVHVQEECGPYVTKPGHPIPDWPQLLRLYSRLKPGKTVFEWMEAYDVHQLNIDIRRFTSFGVIKGFLRRVHRWPVLLPPSDPQQNDQAIPLDPPTPTTVPIYARRRGESFSGPILPSHQTRASTYLDLSSGNNFLRRRSPSGSNDARQLGNAEGNLSSTQERGISSAMSTAEPFSSTRRARRASAAEKVLEQLRNRDMQKTGGASAVASPRLSWIHHLQKAEIVGASHVVVSQSEVNANTSHNAMSKRQNNGRSEIRRHSIVAPSGPPASPVTAKGMVLPPSNAAVSNAGRSRNAWSPSLSNPGHQLSHLHPYPRELPSLLNGECHTDELAVKFEVGWPVLEKWLLVVGGGNGGEADGDFGRICIIYR